MRYSSILLSLVSVLVLGMPFIVSADTTCAFQSQAAEDYGAFGRSTGSIKQGSPFTVSSACTVSKIGVKILKIGSPTGNVVFDVYSDSGGSPSTLLGSSAGIAPALVSGSFAMATATVSDSISLSVSTTYWVVARVMSGQDDSNYYRVSFANGSVGYGAGKRVDSSSWISNDGFSWTQFEVDGTSGGGGGGGSATSTFSTCTYLNGGTTTPCVQIWDNPTGDLGFGMLLFVSSFWGTIWFFRKRGN